MDLTLLFYVALSLMLIYLIEFSSQRKVDNQIGQPAVALMDATIQWPRKANLINVFPGTSGNSLNDEALTCNVCDRSFASRRQLSDHQQKKRHFGCSACDSLFPSLMALEHHKEEFQHWSDSSCCSHSESDDSDEPRPRDTHRLL